MLTTSLDARTPVASAPRREAIDWRRWQFWLPIAAILGAILLTSAEMDYAKGGGGEIYGAMHGSSTARRAGYLMLGAVGCMLLLARRPAWKVPFRPTISLAAVLLTYVFASVLWSVDPPTTVKRAILLTCIVLGGFGIGKHWSLREFAIALFGMTSFFLIISVLAELAFGTFLVSSGDSYRFSGVFHPAKQAFNCGFLVLASLSLYFSERRKFFLLVAGIAFAFVVLTKARTGLVATVVASVVFLWPYLSTRAIIGVGVVAGWIAAATIIVVGATGQGVKFQEVAAMGRDMEQADPAKLTGRVTIWAQALEEFTEQPVLGHGYGAFWTPRRLEEFERRNGWALAHSHSGYIESLINLGIVGLIMVLTIALTTMFRSLAMPASGARLVAAILMFALVGSVAETSFVSVDFEFICVVTCVGLVAFEPSYVRIPIRQVQGLQRPLRHAGTPVMTPVVEASG